MRLAPTSNLLGKALDFSLSSDFVAGTNPDQFSPGTIIQAAATDGGPDTTSNVANWGMCELMYVVNSSSSTFLPGNLVQVDKDFAISAAATTANTGAPLAVCLTRFTAGNTTRQGGWVMVSGVTPVSFSVAATTGAVFLGTSGNATPTAAAGKQILNATTIIAAASTFTRSVTTQSGSSLVKVGKVTGMYPGQAISGTGIPASSVISSIDPSGVAIVIGSAVGTPVAATATGTVTATMTNTGYGIVRMSRPFVQGQIT